MLVGQRIKRLREDNNMKQKELAKMLKVSSATMSYYESNEKEIPFRIIVQIADIFKVDINYLAGINNLAATQKQEIKLSNEELKFLLLLRETESFRKYIDNPENFVKMIELKLMGYKQYSLKK